MNAPSLEQYQKLFTKHLLSEQLSDDRDDFLMHLVPMFGSESKKAEALARFAIYRNNVILSLSTAVADTFPVIKRLIGDDCFNAAAIAFVRKYPPEQPSLLFYGAQFIAFIKTFPGCIELPYLSDIGQLEWLYIRAFHAADAELLDPASLQQIDPELLADTALQLHPSVQLMQSPWPVDAIWEENLNTEVATLDLTTSSGCHLLIYRHQLQVQVVDLTLECFNFLNAFAEGKNIADAWTYTLSQQQQAKRPAIDESELSAMLAYLLNLSIFTGLSFQPSETR